MSVQRYPPSVRGRMRDVDVDALGVVVFVHCAVVSLVFWYFSGTGSEAGVGQSAAAGASVWYRK